jgi:hypothetical protein
MDISKVQFVRREDLREMIEESAKALDRTLEADSYEDSGSETTDK